MKSGTIVARVVLGTVVVAVLSSIVLALTGAAVATFVWRANEARELAETAAALVRAIQAEAVEERKTLDDVAEEALEESAVVGYHIEVWHGSSLLAKRATGRIFGPPGASERDSYYRAGWLVAVRPVDQGVVLIVAVHEGQSLRALHVFSWSLLGSAPLSLLLAIVVGRLVGRRTTRPLVAFTEKVATLRGLEPLELAAEAGDPAEVRELERSFQALLARVRENVAREKEFASNASHELRTPLTRIRLHADRALADAGTAGRDEISAQLGEIDRLVRLVDSLLVLAHDAEIGISRGEVVNLADLARDLTKRVFGPSSPPDARLPDEALVVGDEDLLSIAIENLLDNAKKFTPAGARSLIELDEAGGRITLSVTSRGVRIADGERERLFERFYRSPGSSDHHDGHGLGLSIAQHIGRLHGGELRCASQATEDARFCLDLPAWRPGTRGTGPV